MNMRLQPTNVVELSSLRSPAEQNRIRLRANANRLGAVIVSQSGIEVLDGAASRNREIASDLLARELWTPDMSFAVPTNPSVVFTSHLRTLVEQDQLARIQTVTESEMTERVHRSYRMIQLPPPLMGALTDSAAKRRIDPDALADAVAQDAYPDYDALLESFGLRQTDSGPQVAFRLIASQP